MNRRNVFIKNVIFILTDTLRAQNLGTYGKTPSPTPHIDAFAKQSVVFTNAYTTITRTDPSITSIMSGNYPLSTGLVNHGKNIGTDEEKNVKNVILLPEILRQNGFKTVAIDWMARWHKRGYNYYSGKLVGITKQNFLYHHAKLLDMFITKLLRRDLIGGFYFSFLPMPKARGYDLADTIIDKAIDILKKNTTQKLFLYMHLWDAHSPHTRKKDLKTYLFDTVEAGYNAEISFIDRELGRLFDHLDKTRQLDNSLVVLVSDHGENLYEHDTPLNHEGLYEDVIHIPLIMRHKLFSPKRIAGLAQHIDILPTILDLLKIPLPKQIDGKSLLPMIRKGDKKEVRRFAYFEDVPYRLWFAGKLRRRRGIKMGDYKYIETLQGKDNELFEIMPREDIKITRRELYKVRGKGLEKENLLTKVPSITNKLSYELHTNITELNKRRLQNDPVLYRKIEKSIQVIKKAAKQFDNDKIALAWTGGKDSTVLLHLIRMAFDGKTPFKVIFNDSTMEFEEVYYFIDKISRLWNIHVIKIKHTKEELKEFHGTHDRDRKKELSRFMKITAINNVQKKYKLKAFMAAIRWDEHSSRSKEKYFSPRSNHMRIHPLLHFTEKDIWKYMRHFGVPYVDLYDRGYRSLGEKPFTKPVPPGGSERSGREKEKEKLMERLRNMGYW